MVSFIGLKIIKKFNILWFCFICIQLNFQKLQTSARTDAAPDARLFSHLIKFSKRGVILILSKIHFICSLKFKTLPHFFFLSDLVKTKLNQHVIKSIFLTNQLNLMFSKDSRFQSREGWKIWTLFYWKPTLLKLF